MPGPIEATGAIRNPTKYGALGMGARQFTGMWTQRSPYRDAAVEYLVSKFYSGSRFDSILDGLNREITQLLTDGRSPGTSVFNTNNFPPAFSFTDWSYVQNSVEAVRTLLDGTDGTIYDATPGQKSALFTKSAGAGAARLLPVNTTLYIGDNVDTKKILRSAKTWLANTTYNVGDFIIDSNGNIQSIQANPESFTITSVQVFNGVLGNDYVVLTLSTPAPIIPANLTASFSGLTAYVALNGQTLVWQGVPDGAITAMGLSANQIAFQFSAGNYGPTADTGTMVAMTANPGTTGGAQPVWSATYRGVTNDGGLVTGVNWTCFGTPVQNWGITPIPAGLPSYPNFVTAPKTTLTYQPEVPFRFWLSGISPPGFSIIDPNGNVQVRATTATICGVKPPTWATVLGSITIDGTNMWTNYGQISPWYATTDYGGTTTNVPNPCCIIDSNGNLQGVQAISTMGTSGASEPVWATAPNVTTTDGSITWVCLGPGSVLWSGPFGYAYSFHAIDGSVSTASPISLVLNGGIGPAGGFEMRLFGAISTDLQIDQVWIWRTAQNGATLILLDIIPNVQEGSSGLWEYLDVSSDNELDPEIPAPIANSADPPPSNALPVLYHLKRNWYISNNSVGWTAGPDAITGNGLTAAPPLNLIAFTGQPIWLRAVTVQNGGIIVGTTDGVWIILGDGTAGNAFAAWSYFASVSVSSWTAIDVYNNALFLMEANGKVSSLAVQYPFNPQTGYTEVGFPIGDQFVKVTTGGINAELYNPATAFLSWNVQSTGETGMYVADGAVGWFRMGIVQPPESGLIWSPRRAILGGTSAVQSIKTSPGRTQLLIGPPSAGPILCRDNTGTVWQDLPAGAATSYPSWDAKGVTLLCSTGQWAETVHVSTKSRAVGARPEVSVLLGEIAPSAKRPYRVLNLDDKSNDPSKTPKSISAYCDRYVLKQSGANTLGDCILVKFDYGSQAFGDQLLDWGILGAVHEEREEAVAAQR